MPANALRKCLVWDLDQTLWHGVLLEGDDVRVRDEVVAVLRTLDARGILHSIASRSDSARALDRLDAAGIGDYFLAPQIGWHAKSQAIAAIAEELDLAADSFAFIDDDPFERAEVAAAHPDILCIDAADIGALVDHPAFCPPAITAEAAGRRASYRAAAKRRDAERDSGGPSQSFLASLGLTLSIAPAEAGDMPRLAELTVRTNQLNSSGILLSADALAAMRASPGHRLLACRLRDRFGDYGLVGFAAVELCVERWTIHLLLVSCRVISRGVGTELMHFLIERAMAAGVALEAVYRPNGVNRMTGIAFRLAGFRTTAADPARLIHDGTTIGVRPPHLSIDATFDERA